MRTAAYLKTAPVSIVFLSALISSQTAFSGSAQEVCDRPVFKRWKTQQSNRLWTPNQDTLLAERTGRVYTYNCFTSEEIDMFFSSHADRIENAHFYPILPNHTLEEEEADGDGGC